MFNKHRIKIIEIINKRIDHDFKLEVSNLYKGAICLSLNENTTYEFKFKQHLQQTFKLDILITTKDVRPILTAKYNLTLDEAINDIVSIIKFYKNNEDKKSWKK